MTYPHRTLLVLLLCLSLLPAFAAAEGEAVSPAAITATIAPGQPAQQTITATLPYYAPKADIVFVFDATMTMSGAINSVKMSSADIMEELRTQVPDTAFGVGSFMDYPHSYQIYQGMDPIPYGNPGIDYAFAMDQDLTQNIDEFIAAIDGFPIGYGGDGPQDYARALWESEMYSWRDGSQRIVVLFGDAPPHAAPGGDSIMKPWDPAQPLFRAYTGPSVDPYCGLPPFGGDPGPDEVMGNGDDLVFEWVVQEMVDNQIAVVAMDCNADPVPGAGYQYDPVNYQVYNENAHNHFRYLAHRTGGKYIQFTGAHDYSTVVNSLLDTTTRKVGELTLVVSDPAYAGWITGATLSYQNVPWGTVKTFDIGLLAPAGTPPGEYTFELYVMTDGIVLGSTHVSATVQEAHVSHPPDVSGARLSQAYLWPPNHKFVDSQILGVTDPDGDPVTVTITGITSDEPTASDKGSGGSKHSPDAAGIGTGIAKLRSERSGNNNGRIYVITYTASDGQGGVTTGTLSACVVHDQGQSGQCIDDGQNYDATKMN